MILTIKVIVIIIITIIKCRGRYRTPTTTSKELLVALHNGEKPLINIKKSWPLEAVRVLYMPLKRLIHHLKGWIRVDYAAWIPYLELSPTWFLKNKSKGNINQHNNNNNYNNNNDSNNNNNINKSNNRNDVIIKLIKNAKSNYFLLLGLSRKRMVLLKKKNVFYF